MTQAGPAGIDSALATLRSGFDQVQQDVDKLRQQIADLQAERERTRTAPLPFEEVWPKFETALNSLRHRRTAYIAGLADPNRQDPSRWSHADPSKPFGLPGNREDAAAWAWMAPDVIRDEMRAAFEAYYADNPPGLPSDQRPAALADVDRRLFDMEVREERLIAAANAAGASIARRGNADPKAILAAAEPAPAEEDHDA